MTVRGLNGWRLARWAGHTALAMSLLAAGCESDEGDEHDHEDTEKSAASGTVAEPAREMLSRLIVAATARAQ